MANSPFDPTPSPEDLHAMFEFGGSEIPPLQAAVERLKNLGEKPAGDEIGAALRDVSAALVGAEKLVVEQTRYNAIAALKAAKVAGAARLVDAALAEIRPARESIEQPSDREKLLAEYDERIERALADQPGDVRADAESMLADPHLVDQILADAEAMGIAGERELALNLYLIGTSRLLDSPNSAIVQGPSSTGKSYVGDRIAAMMPPESILRATDMTANALYYLPPGSLVHRLVVAGERSRKEDDQRAEATRALREMQSAGELRKVVAMKEGDGQIATKILHQFGPIAYIESTTLTNIFEEDANRCLLLASDESAEQTRRVIDAHARAATGVSQETRPIIERHHAAQRMLKRVSVTIPFAGIIAKHIPTDRPEARRAFNHLLDAIRALALLHQRQRASGPLEIGDAIEAAPADYVVAARLLRGPLGRSLGRDLAPATINAAGRWRERYGDRMFTVRDVLRDDATVKSDRTAQRHLRALADAGVAEETEPARGSTPAKWRIVADPSAVGATWLPSVEEIERGAQ